MSAPGDRRPDDDEPGDESGAEREEDSGGLGLTEEFARIEAEIEEEVGAGPEARGDTGDWAAAGDAAAANPDDDDEASDGVHGADAAAEPEPDAEDDDSAGEEDDGETDDEPERLAEPAPAHASATEHTVVRPPPPRMPVAAATAGVDEGPGDRTPSLWLRFLTGSILIIVSTATAVAVSALLFLTSVAADLRPIAGIEDKLDAVNPGEAQTILILGSDKRPGDETARSDTTMLLRLDPGNDVLSLFSLPRDLKVDVPGLGVTKLNEAYSAGGPELTIEAIRNLTGLEINHVVNVDFQGFADAVDAIGCVYVDIDRDYFNDNAGLYGEQEYAEIDVNSGYQRLCGLKALQYVRYRHTDTDIVRAARQQDFLREARQKIQPRELLFDGTGNDLIDIFTKYTKSDVSQASQVIGILKSFIAVRDVPIREVHFNGELGPSFVTATPEQIDKAVEDFLGEGDSKGPRGGSGGTDPAAAEEVEPEPEQDPGSDGKNEKDPTKGADVVPADPQFERFAGTSARRLDMPVFYPTEVAGDGLFTSIYDPGSRQYEIKDENDRKHDAYKLVIQYTSIDTVPEYYGVQGTSWTDPPILENPSETRTFEGRDYDLYYDGDRLRLVAWREGGNVYWVSNTLLQTLEEADMLAIATSTKEIE